MATRTVAATGGALQAVRLGRAQKDGEPLSRLERLTRGSYRFLGLSVVFATALIVVAAAPVATSAERVLVPSQMPAAPGPDVNQLFAKIYPVFTHPRCINCHGVVQSFPGMIRSVTGDTHPGDEQGSPQVAAECGTCHDESPAVEKAWEFTAPESMWWVGMDVDRLCALQAAQVKNFNDAAGGAGATVTGSYLNHLTTDPLITQAFNGRAGGAFDENKPAEKPPLTRAGFLAAAASWVNAGAPCLATGTIWQIERFQTRYDFSGGMPGTTTVVENARRHVQINRYLDGSSKAWVTMNGQRSQTTFFRQDGCDNTIRVETSWVSEPLAAAAADVAVRVHNGKYEIPFSLPAESTKKTLMSRTTSSCGGGGNLSVGPETDEPIEWQPWEFSIHCPATFVSDKENSMDCDPAEPQKNRKINGFLKRTIRGQTDTERQSWLNESPVGIARSDTGAPLPVTVYTFWHLDLGPLRP
jgi:hypothetical protein